MGILRVVITVLRVRFEYKLKFSSTSIVRIEWVLVRLVVAERWIPRYKYEVSLFSEKLGLVLRLRCSLCMEIRAINSLGSFKEGMNFDAIMGP